MRDRDGARRASCRSSFIHPDRPEFAGRGRVPLRARADPRRGVRRHAEAAARRAPRADGGLAQGAGRARPTSSSATTSSRPCRYRREVGRARSARSRARGRGGRPARRRPRGRRSCAATRRRRGRLLERAVALVPAEDQARPALLHDARARRSSRRAGSPTPTGCSTRRSRAPSGRRPAPRRSARGPSRSSRVSTRARAAGTEQARRRRRRGAAGARAPRRRVRPCRAWRLRAWIEWTESRAAAADDAWRRATAHARRAGDERELFEILGWRASAAAFGPTPVR